MSLTIEEILNPSSDVHIRVKLKDTSALLSASYEYAVIFVSDSSQSVATGETNSKALSKKVDLSGAGNRVNVDFKFATQPGEGDEFLISAVLYDDQGSSTPVTGGASFPYYRPPTHGTDYTMSLESSVDSANDEGQIKMYVNYIGNGGYHHKNIDGSDNTNDHKITHFSINVIKSPALGGPLIIHSKRFLATDLSDIVDGNGYITGHYYIIKATDVDGDVNADNANGLQINDVCEVSLYAENAGGHTDDVITEAVKIDNTPGILALDLVTRGQVRTFGDGVNQAAFGDYVTRPKITLSLKSPFYDNPAIEAITYVDFRITKKNLAATITSTKTLRFGATVGSLTSNSLDISGLNAGTGENSNTVDFLFKHYTGSNVTLLKDINGNDLEADFFDKAHHYLFEVCAGNANGTPAFSTIYNTEDSTDATPDNAPLFVYESVKNAYLLSPTSTTSNYATATYNETTHKTFRETNMPISFKYYLKVELGNLENTLANVKSKLNKIVLKGGTGSSTELGTNSGNVNVENGVYVGVEEVATQGELKDEYIVSVSYFTESAIGQLTNYTIRSVLDVQSYSITDSEANFETVGSEAAGPITNINFEQTTGSSNRKSVSISRAYFSSKNTYEVNYTDAERADGEIQFRVTTTNLSVPVDLSSVKYHVLAGSETDNLSTYLDDQDPATDLSTDGYVDNQFDYVHSNDSNNKSGNFVQVKVYGKFPKIDVPIDYSTTGFNFPNSTDDSFASPNTIYELGASEIERIYIPTALTYTINADSDVYTVQFNNAGYYIDKIWWLQQDNNGSTPLQPLGTITSKYIFDSSRENEMIDADGFSCSNTGDAAGPQFLFEVNKKRTTNTTPLYIGPAATPAALVPTFIILTKRIGDGDHHGATANNPVRVINPPS